MNKWIVKWNNGMWKIFDNVNFKDIHSFGTFAELKEFWPAYVIPSNFKM